MIRWIDSSVGTAAFGDLQANGYPVLDVRGIVDGPGNSVEALRSLVEGGVAQLALCTQLVVCCDLGVSRSNTIAAAILARRDGVPFDTALRRVQEATGERRMDYGLVNRVRESLAGTESADLQPGRILLTGGSGFLGRAVRQAAVGQRDIVSPNSSDLDLLGSPFELDRIVGAERPSVIVHLANPRMSQTADVIPQALAMMRNVLDVAVHHGVFVVFASGWNVLNGCMTSDGGLLPDDVPCRPYGYYATSKALCEHMIDLAESVLGAQAAILRLSPVYGPGGVQPRLIRRIAEDLRAGRPACTHVYRNGRPRLQLLHVQDAARALTSAADVRVPGRFNVGGQSSLTTREIARTIADVLQLPFESREMTLTADVAQVTLDCSKAKRVLGWAPEIPLEAGLAAMLCPGR